MLDLKTTPTFRVPDIADLDGADQAAEHLRTYFGLSGRAAYTGAHFERLAGGGDRAETRDVLCAEDLIAVTMLSVEVKPTAALSLLEDKSTEITQLLQQIPTSLELVDAGPVLRV